MVEGIQLLGSGLNTDDHPLVRPNGDSVFRQDIVYGQDGDFGSLVGIKAATEVPLLPEWSTWANKACIGSCEYIQNNSFIFLLYGETTVGQTTTKNVVIGEVLSDDSINVVGYLPPNMPVNYTKDTRIYPYIIDKFLGFTDGIVEPILINIERAKLYQQNKTFKYVDPFTPEISTNDVVYWKGMGLYRYKGTSVTAPADYYVLKAIRDANPNSLLPSKWSDDKDPFTQWDGVSWDESKQHVWRLILDDFNISSLPNVNQLQELIVLTANRNFISSINVTGLSKLDNLQLDNNTISSIDVSTNNLLSYLSINVNKVSSLNVNGTILTSLLCRYNNISLLDVSSLTNLLDLDCSYNILTSLNLTGVTKLRYLTVNNNLIPSIPSLTSRQYISVGDANLASNKFNKIEVDRLLELGYTQQEIGVQFPDAISDVDYLRLIRDANPTSQLPSLWLDSEDPYTQWEGVTWSVGNAHVIELDISSKQLTTLTGIKYLTSITHLNCSYNQISSLNIIGLLSLTTLICSSNKLTTLDISSLTNITYINCQFNELTYIDVSGLSSLTYLDCYNNKLSDLSSILTKGLISTYDFRYNIMDSLETDRLIDLGFDSSLVLPQK